MSICTSTQPNMIFENLHESIRNCFSSIAFSNKEKKTQLRGVMIFRIIVPKISFKLLLYF